ncbi:5-oxoprolinase subunit PxpB [Sphingobacterium sp. SGR-19]|uniref:5-oxoprolinase subunit PxpB n=1 Tax=Sphingobacterium sp. SGR-19 TaxID=2710886 RepID=UPI0019CFD453|nr:5-oxoprolinase subunit PxpB [Sphingobacterium sp. SGR-19]
MMNNPESVSYYPLGDAAVVAVFSETISEQVNHRIRIVGAALDKLENPAILEYVPAFTTITVYYNPISIDFAEVVEQMQRIVAALPAEIHFSFADKVIPVWYEGPDIDEVADYTGLSKQEVVRLHSENEYIVYMIGFAPGFAYLGGMDSRLSTPRKPTPRLKIEPGSVGIAGAQTGIYPIETPGGWQIIGKTPVRLFDTSKEIPSFLAAGDRLRFDPISEAEYLRMKGADYGD